MPNSWVSAKQTLKPNVEFEQEDALTRTLRDIKTMHWTLTKTNLT